MTEPNVITPDLQRFTLEQIEAHCEKILNKRLSPHDACKLLLDSVQIIKQLQSELAIHNGTIQWAFGDD